MFLTPYQLALIAGGFAILGALLGNWISHRFSDYRDRRKEFNDAAEILFNKLSIEKTNVTAMYSISRIEFETFSRNLPFLKQRSFDKWVKEYYTAKKDNCVKSTKTGAVSIQNKTPIVERIDKLLEFTKRK